jgi:threonine/homoserine/homoserine lactone efflux protein
VLASFMIPLSELLTFALAALVLVLTPGPNMIYLISRSITQGRVAGTVSLLGVIVGFLFHMMAASFGLTAILLAVPFAYSVIKFCGAAYLLYLAWQAVKPGAASPFELKSLQHDSGPKLFQMGLLTSMLNPKIAVFYMAVLPQFISPEHGSALAQSLTLGFTQIAVSSSVNFFIVLTAGTVAAFLATRPTWLKFQRYLMATVLGGLAVRLALEERK